MDVKDDDKRVQPKEDYYTEEDNTFVTNWGSGQVWVKRFFRDTVKESYFSRFQGDNSDSITLLDKIVKWFKGIIEKIKYVIKNK